MGWRERALEIRDERRQRREAEVDQIEGRIKIIPQRVMAKGHDYTAGWIAGYEAHERKLELEAEYLAQVGSCSGSQSA